MSDIDPDTSGGGGSRGDSARPDRPQTGEPSAAPLDDEAGIERVLRAAGGRARPADEMKAAVRAAVHAEWRATVARRSRRRVSFALAASVVVAALALWVSRAYFTGSHEVVASVSLTTGTVQSRSGSFGIWHAVVAQAGDSRGDTRSAGSRESFDTGTNASRVGADGAARSIHTGETLMTGSDGRVALQLRDGVSLRLDYDTRVTFVGPGRVDVKSGAVYVDAGTTPTVSDHLRVGTPAGVVQHVGTQYEARIVAAGTRIRVREGRVDLLSEHGNAQTAGVGEQLLVAPSGEIQRASIAPNDAEWSWAANAAPPFDINGRAVREFLAWVGRELGREIVYTTPESESEADRAVLSGSVAGLTPANALAAVLPTTQLRSIDRDGEIEITLQ
jgi:ferric-dicitrate binding protein FerR (iron transport regulator)